MADRIRDMVAREGTVVSVPSGVIGYLADTLRFAETGQTTVEQAGTAAEFAELVNRVPKTGPVWEWDGVDHLWDIYRDVLGAELAVSTRTPDEERRFRAAQAVLYTEDGGIRVPSTTYLAYQSCQHAVLSAQAALAQAQTTGNAHKPELAAAVEAAEQDWLVTGHRREVDTALLDFSSLGDSDPAQTWSAYQRQFDPEPGSLQWATALDGSRYAVTGFAPSNILDHPWPRLHITGSGLDSTASALESVSFEYALVNVVRPWLDPAMLRSRAWKFSEQDHSLSDGQTPPSGRCTSYVESVVVARSLQIVFKAHPGDGRQELGFIEPSAVTQISSAAASQGTQDLPSGFIPSEQTERVVEQFAFPAAAAESPAVATETVTPPEDGTVMTTPPGTVLLVAFVLRLLPKCPDPDPALPWERPDQQLPEEATEPQAEKAAVVKLANVRYGQTNEDVRTVQKALIARGHSIAPGATGHFGDATRKAYAAEQQKQGFCGRDADGIPGCRSLTALGKAIGFSVQC
ncbi:peptidoglycan-binding protein [Streptomyces adustus]